MKHALGLTAYLNVLTQTVTLNICLNLTNFKIVYVDMNSKT